jgi:uncharacterized protein DUF4384
MYGLLSIAVATMVPVHPGFMAGPGSALPGPRAAVERPRISVWVDREQPYHQGDEARVYFRSGDDAYVTIVRIDTDGLIRILFPVEPWEDNYARGGRTFEVLGRSQDRAFRIDDEAGVGYVFAIASPDPFAFDAITRGDHWDYRAISDGRVRGDPYVAATDLAARITDEAAYDYDVAEYYVERHYDYPRFVCYDCHSYASYHSWDPYDSFCSRFRIVIYDDPYYYPYRHYGGRTVVVSRPYRPAPRYVFKDYNGRSDYITRVAQRPIAESQGDDRDRSSVDVGGRGSVPIPVVPRRRASEERVPVGPLPRPTAEQGAVQEPRRSTPESARRPQDAAAPGREKPSRGKPAQKPQNDRSRDKPPPPRSTGEPELRRRPPS